MIRARTSTIEAPEHLRNHERTREALAHHRRVFLTEEKAHRKGGGIWAGVLLRLQGRAPNQKWDSRRPLKMEYESLLEFPRRYQITGNDADRDLLYSLHGCQLHSTVIVVGQPGSNHNGVKISF